MIHCAISAGDESNTATKFVLMTVKSCFMNNACQNITRIKFQFQKVVTLLYVTPAKKKKIERTEEIK